MKKLVLLFGLLLPLFGFSQVDLVRWNGANNSLAPTTASNVSSQDIIGNGSVGISAMFYDPNQQFFQTTPNWPNAQTNGGVVDNSKYIQFEVGATAGNQVILANFKFQAHMQGNPAKFLIRYSKDANFLTNVYTLLAETSLAGGDQSSWTAFNLPFNSVINPVLSTEKVYIRFYSYNTYDRLEIARINASNSQFSPTITGTVTAATPTCTPPTNSQVSGNNVWNGYVYTYSNENSEFNSAATYIGTITDTPTFDRDFGSGQINGVTRNIPCVTPPSDRFLVRYLMTTPSLTAGDYNVTVGADDGYRLYIDGVLQTDLSDWAAHSYGQKTKKVTLSAGSHNFKYEYFEREGSARVMFSYGKIAGDISTPFGNNVWNVYAYNSDVTLNADSFVGSYVDTNLNINTENFWNANASPSINNTATYNGAPVTKDYFTTVYKRAGFPCGKYSLKIDKWDDDVLVLLNGAQIASISGNNSNYAIANVFVKPTDMIEIRVAERGGDAVLKFSLTDVPTVFSATSTPTAAQVLGTSIRIEKNYTLTTDLSACSCTVVNGNTLTIPASKTLVLDNNLTVETGATMTIENNGSLVQISDVAVNTGSINVKRTTAPVKRYDFTYWSSPVGSGFTLYNLSPNTLGDKYYSYNPVSGWMIHYNGNEVMAPGKGYIVRAPQEYDINNPAVYNATFTGKPNNGIIAQAIVANASNLIGNPYPSAISADAIYNANSDKIGGTFYFWTHNSLPSSANSGNAIYNYSSDDYASYNVLGGVKTKSAATGGQSPTGNIGAGQSFFIAGKTSANLTFSNSMRAKNAGDNSQFFRTSNTTQSEGLPVTIEKSRLWLNISNEAGDFNETLVGYISNATNGMDEAFDGANLSSGNTTLYSIIDSNNLVIQGRALPFTNTDVVPLGMKISTAGQYTINMDQFDGLFLSQNIYLFDSLTNTTHDLKANDYVFNSEAGTFNSRFEIRYVNGTELGIDTPIVSNNDVVVYKSGNQIAVRVTNFTIDTVQVYDITGKLLTSGKNVNNTTFSTTGLNVGNQVVIVKVTLDDNQTVSKKVIMN